MPKQVQHQQQQFSVLPQQIQLLKLFHLTTLGLESRIQEELLDNPLLEEQTDDDQPDASESSTPEYDGVEEFPQDDIPDYALEHQNYLSDRHIPDRAFPAPVDFRNDIKVQLQCRVKDPWLLRIAEYLADSVNEDGLLDQTLDTITDDMSFQWNTCVSITDVEEARQLLLSLEPPGLGCLNLREFLLLQLQQLESEEPAVLLASQLLQEHFHAFTHLSQQNLAGKLSLPEADIRQAVAVMSGLRKKPLTASAESSPDDRIVFDFVITRVNDKLEASLFRQRSSTLFINQRLQTQLSNTTKSDIQAQQYLKSKLSSAQWFVSAIEEREQTMLKVMREILRFQEAYFEAGDQHLLQPMILKNIAEKAGVHLSTVSRITCNKYADTPFGAVLLKDLFTKGVETNLGETVSNRVIQLAIEELVDRESKAAPHTDQELVQLLADKGYTIARRTVSKYRGQRNIPVTQMRSQGTK